MRERAIDHAIVVVDDLDAAAERLLIDHGLGSVEGGRHTGHGTANRIVPLGDSYLELMGVVSEAEAARSPMGRWALDHRSSDLVPAAVCLRTGDASAEAARLGLAPVAMHRVRPDGVVVAWQLVGVEQMFAGTGLPFFIEWGDPSLHPGLAPAEHRVSPRGLSSVILRGDAAAITARVGTPVAGLTIESGTPGDVRVEIATAAKPIVL